MTLQSGGVIQSKQGPLEEPFAVHYLMVQLFHDVTIFRSPRFGVNLRFQFVSSASTACAMSAAVSTATTTFTSHIKTTWVAS